MTDEELIEQLARALDAALAFEVERDVYAGETTHEERCAIARAILPIIKAENERLREALDEISRRTGLLIHQNTGRWDMRLEHDKRTAGVLTVNQRIARAALKEIDNGDR